MKRYIRSASASKVLYTKYLKDSKELAQLANDEDERVRAKVAENLNTPTKVLAQLANDRSSVVRCYVAGNPNTPADSLAHLADDEDEIVRWNVGSNPSTSADVLMQLTNDTSAYVRQAVAKNLNTPADMLVQLANDRSKGAEYVRYLAAKNPNAPADAIQNRSKSNSPQSNSWQAILSELENDCKTYGDPLYEQSPAGKKLLELCYEVENKMHLYLEPYVQAGQGDISIYDNETAETLAENIDYAEFNVDVVNMVLKSTSADEFKRVYETYLFNLVD